MTNATKTLSAIFVIVLLLNLGNLAFSGGSISAALASKVIEFDKSAVNQIIVKQPDKPQIVLEKTGDRWEVLGENDHRFEADSQAVKQALEQGQNLKIKSLATRNEDKFSRFQVDSTGTRVEFFKDAKKLAGLIVGKFNFVSQREFNTYLRSTDKNEVFAVEGFVSAAFNKDMDGWRNKRVWDFERDAIQQIDFIYPADSSFTITRIESGAWMSESDTLKKTAVNSTLTNLSTLRAQGFDVEKDLNTFGQATFTITVHLDSGQKRNLMIRGQDEDGAHFLAKADDFEYVFTLGRENTQRNVLISRSALVNR